MTIKYEPVFGDQSLFYNAQADCEMVGNGHHKVEHGKLMVWNFSGKYWSESYTSKIAIEAMRRVIKTPTWTRADQEAGVLPPVGSAALYTPIKDICRTKITESWVVGGIIECIAHVFVQGEELAVMFSYDAETVSALRAASYSPIETPEEKAARLKEEWCEAAKNHYFSEEKGLDFFSITYDALLSGELKAPTNE